MSEEVWHAMEVDDVLRALRSNEKGLSEEEVERRLEEFGPNELREEKRVTALSIFFGQFKSTLIVILIIAALVSGFLLNEVLDMYLISAIVVMNAILGFVQEYRAEKAMEALKRMITPVAKVVREGKELMKPSKELVPGDIILLDGGDRVPADARLIETVHLRTDEAPLTGESVPITKEMGCLKENTPVTDRVNMIFMGTHVIYGRGKAIVIATGMNTEFGKIAGMTQAVEEKPSPLKVKIERLGRQLGLISLLGCVGTVLMGLIVWHPFVDMFLVGVGLAVSAIPEGLPAVLTITLSLGAARMAKNKAVVRKLASVETLGCATVICSDKTGTLTRNEMTVRELYVNGQTIHVTGVGYDPKGEFLKEDKPINPQSDDYVPLLLRIGCLCNNAQLEVNQKGWYIIGDPTEGALVTVAVKAGIQQDEIRGRYPRIDEILFDSERKRMSTIHTTPSGEKIAYVKGAPEILLGLCSHLYEHGRVRTMTDNDRKRVLMTTQNMASRALRVLAMAYRKLPNMLQNFTPGNVETRLTFVGLVGMIDPARKEVSEAIKQCKQADIRSVMITGDHKLTAIAVAKEIGMLGDNPKVLTGAELDELSDEELKRVVEEVVVYARSSPEHKVRIAQALREKGHIIAMTGDGVNDAPAVKNSGHRSGYGHKRN